MRTDSNLGNLDTCITPFQENNPCSGKGPLETFKCWKKNSIPMQNMHDLLVGTLSISIPSKAI